MDKNSEKSFPKNALKVSTKIEGFYNFQLIFSLPPWHHMSRRFDKIKKYTLRAIF